MDKLFEYLETLAENDITLVKIIGVGLAFLIGGCLLLAVVVGASRS